MDNESTGTPIDREPKKGATVHCIKSALTPAEKKAKAVRELRKVASFTCDLLDSFEKNFCTEDAEGEEA